MGASRHNPRSAAFKGDRTPPSDGPKILNQTTNVRRVRFIPAERRVEVAGQMKIVKTKEGSKFTFSDRQYKIGSNGEMRRVAK